MKGSTIEEADALLATPTKSGTDCTYTALTYVGGGVPGAISTGAVGVDTKDCALSVTSGFLIVELYDEPNDSATRPAPTQVGVE